MATRILTEEDKQALEGMLGQTAAQAAAGPLRLLTERDRQELEEKIAQAGPKIELESIRFTPAKSAQNVTAEEGKAYSEVTVEAIPEQFQDVSGVTAQPEQVLEGWHFVDSTGELQEGQIPSRSAADLSVSGMTVAVPAGYYETDAYKSVEAPDTGDSEIALVTTSVTSTKGTQEVTPNAGEAFSKVIVNPIPDQYQDVSGVTAQPGQVLDGYTFVDSAGRTREGTIPVRSEADLTATTRAVTVPAGFYEQAVTKEVDVEVAEGSGIVFSDGDVSLNRTNSSILASAVLAAEKLLPAGTTIEFQLAGSRFGNAAKTDVVFGKTFTSENGLNISGTKPVDEGSNTAVAGTAEADSLDQLHYWEKSAVSQTIDEETVADYLLWNKSSYGTQSTTYGFSQYAQEIEIIDGELALVNPQSRDSVASSDYDTVLPGKYIQNGTTIYRIPADAVISTHQYTGATQITADRVFQLTYLTAGSVSVVVSDDADAYPENGEQEGFTYVYQGTLSALEKTAVIQALTVTDNGTFAPPDGVDGYAPVTVNVASNEVPAVEQATPSITVSTSGLITASATQEAGQVAAGTKSATKQLTTQAAQEITPGTSDKTIASGLYLTGTQTIKGDANLKAANIVKGVSIFGVTGSHECAEGFTLPTLDNPGDAGDLVEGVELIGADGSVVTGQIPKRTSSNLTASGATVSVPAGYYESAVSKAVATATQATPSISVDSAGKITASATQSAGYVSSGTKSATKQLTVQAAQEITPGTSDKTIASGLYLTGTQTIKGDSNLKAANIKSGVSIFGVAGSLEASSGGAALVTKSGTTTSASVDTGLSEVVAFLLKKGTINTTGLTQAAVLVPLDAVHYGGCSSYQSYMKSYANGTGAISSYCTIDGGTVAWTSTLTAAKFVADNTYTWEALGYE